MASTTFGRKPRKFEVRWMWRVGLGDAVDFNHTRRAQGTPLSCSLRHEQLPATRGLASPGPLKMPAVEA
eukprot:1484419-Prorocentrum_lima.AAC.1